MVPWGVLRVTDIAELLLLRVLGSLGPCDSLDVTRIRQGALHLHPPRGAPAGPRRPTVQPALQRWPAFRADATGRYYRPGRGVRDTPRPGPRPGRACACDCIGSRLALQWQGPDGMGREKKWAVRSEGDSESPLRPSLPTAPRIAGLPALSPLSWRPPAPRPSYPGARVPSALAGVGWLGVGADRADRSVGADEGCCVDWQAAERAQGAPSRAIMVAQVPTGWE